MLIHIGVKDEISLHNGHERRRESSLSSEKRGLGPPPSGIALSEMTGVAETTHIAELWPFAIIFLSGEFKKAACAS